MALIQFLDASAGAILGIATLWIAGRQLYAHSVERRAASDDDARTGNDQHADAIRKTASFQNPLLLAIIIFATAAKMITGFLLVLD